MLNIEELFVSNIVPDAVTEEEFFKALDEAVQQIDEISVHSHLGQNKQRPSRKNVKTKPEYVAKQYQRSVQGGQHGNLVQTPTGPKQAPKTQGQAAAAAHQQAGGKQQGPSAVKPQQQALTIKRGMISAASRHAQVRDQILKLIQHAMKGQKAAAVEGYEPKTILELTQQDARQGMEYEKIAQLWQQNGTPSEPELLIDFLEKYVQLSREEITAAFKASGMTLQAADEGGETLDLESVKKISKYLASLGPEDLKQLYSQVKGVETPELAHGQKSLAKKAYRKSVGREKLGPGLKGLLGPSKKEKEFKPSFGQKN